MQWCSLPQIPQIHLKKKIMIAVNVLFAKGAFTPDGHSGCFPFAIIIKLLGHSWRGWGYCVHLTSLANGTPGSSACAIPNEIQLHADWSGHHVRTNFAWPSHLRSGWVFFHNAWGVISLAAVNSGHWLWLCLWISLNFNAFWKHWCAIFFKQESSFTDPLPGCC